MNDTTTHVSDSNLRVQGRRSSADVPRRFKNILCLDDFEEPARRFLPRPIFGYVSGGVETNAARDGNRAAFVVGELDGRVTDRVKDIVAEARIFEPEAIVTEDIAAYLWGKLAYGSLLFAQAVGDLGIADCLARPELLPLWRALAGEVMRVAAAEGVSPLGFNGFDPAAFTKGAMEEQAQRCVEAMVASRIASKTCPLDPVRAHELKAKVNDAGPAGSVEKRPCRTRSSRPPASIA